MKHALKLSLAAVLLALSMPALQSYAQGNPPIQPDSAAVARKRAAIIEIDNALKNATTPEAQQAAIAQLINRGIDPVLVIESAAAHGVSLAVVQSAVSSSSVNSSVISPAAVVSAFAIGQQNPTEFLPATAAGGQNNQGDQGNQNNSGNQGNQGGGFGGSGNNGGGGGGGSVSRN